LLRTFIRSYEGTRYEGKCYENICFPDIVFGALEGGRSSSWEAA